MTTRESRRIARADQRRIARRLRPSRTAPARKIEPATQTVSADSSARSIARDRIGLDGRTSTRAGGPQMREPVVGRNRARRRRGGGDHRRDHRQQRAHDVSDVLVAHHADHERRTLRVPARRYAASARAPSRIVRGVEQHSASTVEREQLEPRRPLRRRQPVLDRLARDRDAARGCRLRAAARPRSRCRPGVRREDPASPARSGLSASSIVSRARPSTHLRRHSGCRARLRRVRAPRSAAHCAR